MVIGSPDDLGHLEDLGIRPKRPMLKVRQGPAYKSGPNGEEGKYLGEVIQVYRPYDDRDAAEFPAPRAAAL